MEDRKTQEFAARIAESSRSELTVIVYDVILEDIKEAREKAADREEFRRLLLHANKFVNELMITLDFKYPLAKQLWSLYEYAGGILTNAAFSGNTDALAEPESIMKRLRDSFAEVAKQDTSGPLMKNTQQITAGLTYGKGKLDEVTTGVSNRGFLA